jgi:hypothetical protein
MMALSHREAISVGIFCESGAVQVHDKWDSVQFNLANPHCTQYSTCVAARKAFVII